MVFSEEGGERRANSDLAGGGFTADNSGIAADESEGVLVEDGCHGFVKFGQLMTELDRAFEEDLDGDRPEFVVVGRGVIAEEIFGAGLLHGSEDGSGDFGEVGEFGFKMTIFLRLGDEVDRLILARILNLDRRQSTECLLPSRVGV